MLFKNIRKANVQWALHLAEHNILHSEQFGLAFGIVEIRDKVTNGFMEIKYAIGVFTDLSEGFSIVNQ